MVVHIVDHRSVLLIFLDFTLYLIESDIISDERVSAESLEQQPVEEEKTAQNNTIINGNIFYFWSALHQPRITKSSNYCTRNTVFEICFCFTAVWFS